MPELRPMTPQDYDAVIALWRAVEGVGLSDADAPEAIGRYLDRNPGLSFTAWDGDRLIGAVLCGHDGRRGYVHHLAVRAGHRRRGVGRALAERCIAALREAGIDKCHLFVYVDNPAARAFWARSGWMEREELVIMSRYTQAAQEA
jgi:ribosomal protein S18 acetylase RimI-like enzyme